jgi:hypothetical protein
VVYFKYQKKGGADDLMPPEIICLVILIAWFPIVLTVLIVLAGVGWK